MNFNLLDYPMALRDPRHLPYHGSWLGHVPFAFALVEMMRPESIVELGVFQGASYCAFCQAVAELGLRGTRCFGIDTWRGDEQTGPATDRILAELRAHHDPLYSEFSQFVQADFDTAAAHVAEGTIDLLHIDGLHTYEAVKHDFETWLPKTSEAGVVLFHDTMVRDRDFGVWRLWEEISPRYPSFQFSHSNGLGVLAVGPQVSPKVLDFIRAANQKPQRVGRMFEMLGDRIFSERLLRHVARFMDITQDFLADWKDRLGQPAGEPRVDSDMYPIRAAERIAREIKSIAAATTPARKAQAHVEDQVED